MDAISTTPVNQNAKSSPAPIKVWEIKSKDSKRFGKVYPGEVVKGHHAEIVPGKSIRLFGSVGQRWGNREDGMNGLIDGGVYVRDFKIGDTAVVGSYNLTYTGKITAITEKTITVVEYHGTSMAKTYRMDLWTFDMRNWDFDADATAKRNAEMMQTL